MATGEHVEDPLKDKAADREEHIKDKDNALKDVNHVGKADDFIKTNDPVTTEASMVEEDNKKIEAKIKEIGVENKRKEDNETEKKKDEATIATKGKLQEAQKDIGVIDEAVKPGEVVEGNKVKEANKTEKKKDEVVKADDSKYKKAEESLSMATKENLKQAQEKRDTAEEVVKDENKKIEAQPREIVVVENKGKQADQTEMKKDGIEKADAPKNTKVEKISSIETKEKLEEAQKHTGAVKETGKEEGKKIEAKPREIVVENKKTEADKTEKKKDEVEKTDASNYIRDEKSSSMTTKVKVEDASKNEVVKEEKNKTGAEQREIVVDNKGKQDYTKSEKNSSMATKENQNEAQNDKGVVEGVVKDDKKKNEAEPRENVVENKGKEVDKTEKKKDGVENVDDSKRTKVEERPSMATKENLEEAQKDKGVVEGVVKNMTKKIEETPRENVVENKGKEVDQTKNKKHEVEKAYAYKCTELEKSSSMATEEKLEEELKDKGGIIEEVVHKKEKNKIKAEPIEIVVENKLKEETTNEVGLKEEKENDQVGNADVSESGEVDKCSSLREEINSLLELNEQEKKALAELRSKIEKAIHENHLLKVDKDQAANEMKQEKETSQEVDDVEAKQEGEEDEKKAESNENNKDVAKVHSNINKDIAIWGVPLLPSKEDNATNVILLKFLKAKDFEVNDAFEMLRNTLKWRNDNNIDSILDENFDEDLGSISIMDGVSREGHPVHYSSFKLFGNEELYNKVLGTEEKRNVFIRSRIQLMERAIQKLDFKSGGVSSIFLVNDCKDMPGPSKKELRIALKQILTLHQDNYPEFVARHIFINVPFWYYAFSASTFLSPFLTPKSNSKFIFARPAKVNDVLLQYIALEELPVHYGGFRKENDPDFSTEDDISEIFLNQSSTEIIRIPMQAGVSLMWEVLVSGWEVNYKEEFIPTDDSSYSVIIQRRKKISGHEGPIRNSFTCKEPGNIVLTIENGALIKKKRICYRYKMMNRSSS
uniref:patellin-5-like n=1 Tax=Fragaria vesca subsp. vesca TaxID=101020 RepID=UPI0005C950BB|nr:PREDICTED: patellin-5-like [Fragaria vesca subsp. vesca]